MMRPAIDLDIVWLCRHAMDFRRGINGLSILVEEQLVRDPHSVGLFVKRLRSKTIVSTPVDCLLKLWPKGDGSDDKVRCHIEGSWA